MRINKPKVGDKCNGCGLCCQIEVCSAGSYIQKLVSNYGDRVDGPCPALTKRNDGTFACGIVLNPKKYIKNRPYTEAVLSKNFSLLIGANTVCDEIGDDENYHDGDSQRLDSLVEIMNADIEWKRKIKIALKVIYGFE